MNDENRITGLEIAVIGMAGRFPGADNVQRFWENLRTGVESIRPLADEELAASGVPPALTARADYVRAGAILEGEDLFDAAFFGFTPREADLLDPQQRLFLECAWEALEDAGYDSLGYARPIGVYAGVKLNTYLLSLYSRPDLLAEVGRFEALIANDKDYLATRVSYKLDLTGPSVVIQTACSTSLAAVHLACQGLLAGECDLALAGAVAIGVPQRVGYLYTEGGIGSPDGHCRAFDARAQGTVGGNGLGIVVLKRLADAASDGDRIYAVIKGSAMNNDGARKTGYTAPSPEGQAKVIRTAQGLAGVDAETITYIEAHGTATSLGDPIEIAALTRAFRSSKKAFCAIGSVKSNIGHLDTAAGIAGLIKTVLMLERRQIPPSLHFSAPNPELGLDESPFYVNTRLREWPTDGTPRRAGVSSFGIGGTNVHLVLEEAPAGAPSGPARPWHLLVLSAATPRALEQVTANLAAHLESTPDQDLADVAYTLQVGRKRLPSRRILVARDHGEAAALLASRDPERVLSRLQEPCDRPVALLFPGQGSQHPGMGRELYQEEPAFRREIDRCAEALLPHLGLDLREILYPAAGQEDAAARRLAATALAQPALFATEYALARLWMEWGVRPEVMVGHSVGEYVAACLAGVFSLPDALRLVAVRGRLMQGLPAGAMLAVELSEEEIGALAVPSLSLAAVNGPRNAVLAGREEEIEALRRRLEARGVSCRRLQTSHAFHSQSMEPALAPFADEVRRVRLAAPQIPFFSNWTGELIRDEEATNPEYWVRHLRGTVRFGAAVGALWQEPNRILLEVGPGRALSTLARQHPERPPNGLVLSSLPAPRERQEGAGSELALLVTALGCLWMGGLAVHWAGFHGDGHRRRVQLPTYPFERRRHWIDAPSHQAAAPLARVAVEAAAPREVADWSPASAGTGHPRPALETAYVSPRTPEEQAVAAVWQSSLGIETVGVYDNFFELGGGSLLATRLAARLRETLGIDLPLRDLLEHPTVAALAAFVAARGLEAKEGAQPLPDLVPDLEHLSEPFPLTDVQQAYWVGRGDALALGNVSPHAYLELELEGFDLERFNRVLCRTIERQHMLRAVVLPDGRQRILPGVPPYRIAVVDLGGIPAGVEAGTLAVREHMSHQVLPSHRWPLFEVVACRLSGGRVRLHVSFDFLLGDAWSLEILLVELLRGYLDPGAVLPPLAISFRDYVLAEETLRASLLYERSLAYWRGRLATLPPGPELPLAKSLAALGAPRFVRRLMTLEAPVWERLKSRAARAGLTASGVLLAAFSDVLAAWSAHPRFTLSLTLFNRLPLHPQVNDLVGDFTSVVLLEADGAGREGFEVRAQRLQSRLWEDLDHRYVSGVAVLRELARVQSRPGSVAVPVVFTSLLGLTAGRRHEMAAGLSAREVYSISQTPQVLLDHQVEEVQGQLVTRWDAVEEAFSAGLLDAMLAAYQNLLRRLAEQEEAWHRTTRDLVGDDQLAARRAGLAAAIPMPETTLHALFEEQASRGPDRPAVVSPDRTLSYAELERWTRRLGHRLRARGAGPGRLVAVVLERGWRQVVAVLAVCRSGAAYLPVDPALPAERLRHLLEYGEAGLALTDPQVDAAIDWPSGTVRLWVEDEELPGEIPALAPSATPEDLAYVIFTSGSTGLPKGVEISHRGAVNTILDVNRRFAVGPEDRVLTVSALNFDLSVYDIFGLLAAGGGIVTVEPEAARDPARWVALLVRERVTLWNSVPALLEMLVEHADPRRGPRTDSLRLVLLSGDWIPVALPDRIRSLAPGARVVSLGGATEASIWSIFFPIDRVDPSWASIPYGRPLTHQSFHVLDSQLEPRPVWVPGDLCIGGIGLAQGYLRDEEKTRASFFVHPRTGERLYRTGDRGRCLPSGDIEFLGREDLQVKIRGHRIELGEIESVLAKHPAIESCAAGAVGEERGDKRLVAWVVCRPGAEVASGELEQFLRGRLPAAMVPASFVPLARMPLTANGKVDRQNLPAPEAAEPAAEDRTAPRSAVEEIVCDLCRDVLGSSGVALSDNFFDRGGHSLLATRLQSRLRDALEVEIPLREVFEAPTIAALAQAVLRQRQKGAGVTMPPLVPEPRDQELPLSFAQQRLWFLKQVAPDSSLYNVHVGVRCQGRLEVAALMWSLGEIVRRHEILRTILPTVSGRPVQVVLEPAPVSLPLVDLSRLPAALRAVEAERWLAGEVRVPLSFAAPLFRTSLLRLGAREHLLLILTHHIVWDDWSRGVLVRDLAAFYCASSAGKASPLPPLPVQYADFALWQRRWLECEDREQHLAYWRRQLDGAPRHLDLPTDRPRPAEQSFRGGELTRRIPAALAERVRVLARHQGSTVFMTLAAAFQVLLCRYSGQRDIVVGTLTGNRNLPEIEDLIGFFVNTLPLRTDLSGDPDFVSVLTRMREAALAAYDHQDLPFDQLVEALKLPRDLGHNPLTQVVFNMFNAGIPAVEIPGLALDLVSTPLGWAPFDLVVTVSSGEGELVCETLFAADLYDPSTVRRLLRHFEILLRGIVAEPARPVAELPLLSAGERGQILLEWNDTGSIFPRDEPIHRIFQAYAEKAPDATGITCGGRSLSYGEIDARANQLARHLRALGVGQELPVGVLAERSPEAVIAILAILKAEGAYVPLDPDEPRERLRSIVEDARMPLLLVTRGKWLDLLPEAAVRQVCLERDQLEIARWSREDLGDPPTPADSLAYVMYTSGSSGRPKGVCVPHRAVVRLVRGVGYAGFGPGEVFLSLAPISFDASTFEIWGALLNGGRLAIFSPQVPSLDELSETVEREGVSTLWLTAGLFHQMVEGRLEGLRPLRQLLAGGDVLSPRQVRQALAHLPGLRLINGYGPTEATTFTCCCPMAHPDEVGPSVSIGRPIGNTRVYLLAPDLALVPVGVAGELFIGGDGLARAYLNSPAATAERFVPDPFGKEAGMRLYRTGDRARYLADGRIEFLGRLDNQVKIRGFRVELGEIEAVLGQHPGIREAAVVVREDGSGHRRLVGYITVREGDPTGELPQFLRQRLPDYMVPGTVVVLDSLPLSPNGKVDRRALPAADAAAPSPAEGYVAPRNPAEETLASIWREILKLDRVGVHDNFFALGGDSILAIQIVARAYDAGLELSPTQLFHHQTIAELAAPALAAEAVSGRPIVQEAAGPAPLTPIQRWFFDLELPEPHHFNHSVLLDVAPDLDKAVLASAVAHLVTRHDALRLSFFKPRGEGWLQVVREPGSAAAPFSHLALSSLPPERRRSTLEAAAAALQSSLDLTAGPLLRAGLFEMGEGEPCRLLFVVHHLAVDGVSWRILLADLAATCRRLVRGLPVPPPPQTLSFLSWARRLAEHARSEAVRAELGFWLSGSSAAPNEPLLPADWPEGENQERLAGTVSAELSAEETQALLREVPAAYGTRIEEVLLTALGRTLAVSMGSRRIRVNLEGHGREELIEGIDLSRTVGWFTSLYPVVLEIEAEADPGAALRSVKEHLRAVPRRGIGYGLLRYLCEDPEIEARLRNQPCAEIGFNYLGQLDQALPAGSPFGFAAESTGPPRGPQGRRPHRIDVDGWIAAERLHVTWTYSTEQFRLSTVEALARQFIAELASLIGHCRSLTAGGFTPSDFPAAGLSQEELDRILSQLG